MENNNILQCEEELRSTLSCDDKEKLRRKLAMLQREYLRTAQKLQRAERLDAARRHVRSRITQHNHQEQRDPEVTPNPCPNLSIITIDITNGTDQDKDRYQGNTKADCESSKRSPVIRFLLPSDNACPQTPDPSHNVPRGHRPSPAMRLRSRRSRLRWEKRSAETERMTDNNEEGQEQSESTSVEAESEMVKSEETEIVNESEELFSGSGSSESPSLLLTHWNAHNKTETGDTERIGIQEYQEQREKETELKVEGKKHLETTSLNIKTTAYTEESGKDSTQSGRINEREAGECGGFCGGESEIKPCKEKHTKNTEQHIGDEIENEKRRGNSMEIKEKTVTVEETKSVGLLDSCTLVEGLLFPAEYYVRTTRRMTLSQSQLDMEPVILSQLSIRRHRRSRGRGRGSVLNTNTHTNETSDEQTPIFQTKEQTDFSSQANASTGPPKLSHGQAADFSSDLTNNSQSPSEISGQISDIQTNINVLSSPSVCTNRPGRGRRRKRGRGRPSMPQSSLSLDNGRLGLGQISVSPKPASTPVSPSPSLSEQINDPLLATTQGTTIQLCSENNEAQSNTSDGQVDKIYPIFLKSNIQNNRHTQMSKSTLSWQTLLLPSCPPSQTCLRPFPCQSLGSLATSLVKLDIHQDFHLPDDQFATLKLDKLRQVAIESQVESFTLPYNTRNSKRLFNSSCIDSSDKVIRLPLLLSPTPPITDSPCYTRNKQAITHSVDQNVANQSLDTTETPVEQQTENLHAETQTSSTGDLPLVEDFVADCVSQDKHGTVILNNFTEGSRIVNTEKPEGEENVCGHLDEVKIHQSESAKQTDCVGVVHSLEEQCCKNLQTKHKTITTTLQGTPGEVSYNCTAGKTCNDNEEHSTVKNLNVKSPDKDLKGPFECTTTPIRDKSVGRKHPEHHSVHSQLLLSPSAICTFITQNLSPSGNPCSPTLPSLGLTPHPALSLTSSPSAPSFTLPALRSPSIQFLSPPVLSPCTSSTSLPSSLSAASVPSQNPCSLDQCHRVNPCDSPTLSRMQSQGSGGLVNQEIDKSTKEPVIRTTHTLKAPAGSCLVDACCLPGHSGGLCVAAAGKWAVCLWFQISAFNWSLMHTWTFNMPVINVFPVPDAAELMCVTLGQLEIREVRVLFSSSFSQLLLYEGVVQAVVGVPKSRVVLSFHSATGSTLQMFDLSDASRPISQHLVSPGVCISALAPVDGLCDALIGTDECGQLFIWNLKTRQLLQKIIFGDDLSHIACLRGYSYCGVLFVLLQYQLLSSPEEEEKAAKAKDQGFSEDKKEAENKKTAFFSLVAVNPITGKSALATKLYPPKAWSGRLCEADVHGFSVVGLSQSGCVCVWELIGQRDPRMVLAPEGEGWQLARWGAKDMLVTGHHNGDVILHGYSHTSLCC